MHKAIVGFEDYLITDTGQVYSLKTMKYLKLRLDRYGYYKVTLYKNGSPKYVTLHRLLAQAFIPNPENKSTVDHIDRNPSNNQLENLRWATYAEQTKNRDLSEMKCKQRKHFGMPINEITKNEEKEYDCLRGVPNISHSTLEYHIRRGEKEFFANGRHFKIKGVV